MIGCLHLVIALLAPSLSVVAQSDAACKDTPSEQACIPAGFFLRGSSLDSAAESPMQKLYLDTFWIDKYEVTNEQYDRCVHAGVCTKKSPFKGFQEPKQPIMPATWYQASTYCRWAGKRLPSEAEWEKAARGTQGFTWPWGHTPHKCSKAHTAGCKPAVTLPVGSLPPNAYGLYDMAGNSYEWTNDWYTECYEGCKHPCGAACQGRNPRGPCDGADSCPGSSKRVLKGGSWFWPADQARPSWRRGSVPDTGGHRLGFRCAATPPGIVPEHAALPNPEFPALPAVALVALEQLPQDALPPQRLQTAHYVTGNELRNDLFRPHIEHVGGAIVGVGSDQGFTLAALADSELVCLFDYDLYVVLVDRIHVSFLKRCETRDAFLAAWGDQAQLSQWEQVVEAEQGREGLETYRKFRSAVAAFLTRNRKAAETGTRVHWLGDEDDYRFIRHLALQQRIRVLKGDLLQGKAVLGISAALKTMGIPANVIYLSNCEEYWSYYTDGFEASFLDLPISEATVVLRTFHDTKLPKAGPDKYYHYNVQTGRHFHDSLARPGKMRYRAMMSDVMTIGKHGEFSLLGFPSQP